MIKKLNKLFTVDDREKLAGLKARRDFIAGFCNEHKSWSIGDFSDVADLEQKIAELEHRIRKTEQDNSSDAGIETIAREIKGWLDWQEAEWKQFGDEDVRDEVQLMGFPVNPSRGVLKNWIRCLGHGKILDEPNVYRKGKS